METLTPTPDQIIQVPQSPEVAEQINRAAQQKIGELLVRPVTEVELPTQSETVTIQSTDVDASTTSTSYRLPDGRVVSGPSTEQRVPRPLTTEEKAEYGLPEDYLPPTERIAVSPIQTAKEKESSWSERKADFDTLTGLANRKALQERFDEQGIASTEGVAMVDLNKFKDLNDKFGGHAAGDAGLQMFSRLLEEHVKDIGTPYRTGGDEFVLVFNKGTGEEDIKLAIKSITEGAKSIVFPRTPETPIDDPREVWEGGASIGYVSTSEITSLEEGLKLADDKMYREKHGLAPDTDIPEREARR